MKKKATKAAVKVRVQHDHVGDFDEVLEMTEETIDVIKKLQHHQKAIHWIKQHIDEYNKKWSSEDIKAYSDYVSNRKPEFDLTKRKISSTPGSKASSTPGSKASSRAVSVPPFTP